MDHTTDDLELEFKKPTAVWGATLAPPTQVKPETSAVNNKHVLNVHVLNLNCVENFEPQPTFSVPYSRLAKTL